MKVVGVFPKQIVVNLEFTLTDLIGLRTALENTTLNLNLEIPEHQAAENLITNELYPTICDILKEIEGQ